MFRIHFTISLILISQSATKAELDIQPVTSPVLHAESPTWDSRGNVLYYVSIMDGGVLAYHYENESLARINLDGQTSPVIPSTNNPNLFLVGLDRSVVAVEWDGVGENFTQEVLTIVGEKYPDSRFNDGKADKQGRLWWGTIGPFTSEGLVMYRGELFEITKDNLKDPTVIRDPVSNSNGLAWNRANDKFYYIDTPTRKVVEFSYNDEEGVISTTNRTVFDVSEFDDLSGDPDGMTIDEDDNLWVCLYGGWSVVHVNPSTGEVLQVVELPARDVTSAMWGGPDLDILYISTSRVSLSSEEMIEQPNAGSIFAVKNLGTKGLPAFTANIIDSL